MSDLDKARARMVDEHLAPRGISTAPVLAAFRAVRREEFVPAPHRAEAYSDHPIAIGEGQTISQPYVVALTVEQLGLRGGERVLEVGTGSGYAAAILGSIAREVYTVERLPSLADAATLRLARLGFSNVHVRCADGSLGWADLAPFDAIAVAAAGPEAPPALLAQLAIGGRLVMPIGTEPDVQQLVRITRVTKDEYRREDVTAVRFVPLIGAQGWGASPHARARGGGLPALVRETAEPLGSIDTGSLDALLDRIGDARLVMLGEATHGSSEFYRFRARLTQELVRRRGFQFVAVEADWPDAARIDDYVLGAPRRSRHDFTPFTRFPTWMWRNEEVAAFVEWLRGYNAARPGPSGRGVGFHGLDLYSMFTSMAAVLSYLDDVDPASAKLARVRYGALSPWQDDLAAYGHAVLVGRHESSEAAVVSILRDLLARRLDYARGDGDRFFDAAQNARVVADAERYYRAMYQGSAVSWNLRDTHMMDTLQSLLDFHGPTSKGIVWAHNSHVGDARATEMSAEGELNIGQLARVRFGDRVYIVGFGTDHGVVAAAHDWDEPMQEMAIVPACEGSYERIFHEAGIPGLTLALRSPRRRAVRDELGAALLERAIGVVYRPRTERRSHYFQAKLPEQFDEYVWFDETSPVRPLAGARKATERTGVPDTYPFGL